MLVEAIIKSKLIRSESSEEEYGDWRKVHKEKVKYLVPTDEVTYDHGFWELPDDSEKGYVAYARYSEGNTYGTSKGHILVLSVFASEDDAQRCIEAVKTAVDGGQFLNTIPFKEREIYISPLTGYFNQCEALKVKKCKVRKGFGTE